MGWSPVQQDAAGGAPDVLLVNAHVITLDPRQPRAEAVLLHDGRIRAVGAYANLRALAGSATLVVDAEGGVAVPAFHDAHLHLLSYARSSRWVDCRLMDSLDALVAALRERAAALPPMAWLRAAGYDETRLGLREHPDRRLLDGVSAERPIRVQHRSQHLDILNTVALERLGLLAATDPALERDEHTGALTGRIYHGAHLLASRDERPPLDVLADDIRQASHRLLAWGVTSVQDASVTNGEEQWELFRTLSERGALGLRLFMLSGAAHWRSQPSWHPPTPDVLRGPVKLMLNEGQTDFDRLRRDVTDARSHGYAVAIHAVSEAEVALALDTLTGPAPVRGRGPDRLEHGGVILDEWITHLRRLGVAVVGQPVLVSQRGDGYREAYPSELHGALHRARSLVAAGVRYAVGSDAPIAEPSPGLAILAARRRETPTAVVLGAHERLGWRAALAACTLGSAHVVGAQRRLGRLRAGMIGDLAVLDPDVLFSPSPQSADRPARLTIKDGRVVWRRPGHLAA